VVPPVDPNGKDYISIEMPSAYSGPMAIKQIQLNVDEVGTRSLGQLVVPNFLLSYDTSAMTLKDENYGTNVANSDTQNVTLWGRSATFNKSGNPTTINID
jgi:hypothetical protein